MRGRLAGLMALGAALALGGTANATVWIATWAGTVTTGSDPAGVFGAPDLDLTGEAFTAVFSIDDARPGATKVVEPWREYIAANAPYVPVTAVLTIKGVSTVYGVHHGYAGFIDYEDRATDAIGMSAFQIVDFRYSDIQMNALSFFDDLTTGKFEAIPTYAGGPGRELIGRFFEVDQIAASGQALLAEGRFSAATLTVVAAPTPPAPPAAVPEPATWALMILGFGGAGAMLRRRRGRELAAETRPG